jgi:hypothetical protein
MSYKVKEKIQLGLKKSNLEFFLDILICHKDIGVFIFPIFLTVHIYLQLQVCNFWTVHSPEHKKFRSVEIFKLSCMISEIKAIIFIYFNSV